MSNEDILREKLARFVRRYYQNQLIRGVIYALGLSLGYLLLLAVAEWWGQFSQSVRLVLFWLALSGLVFIVGYYLLWPVFKLMGLGKRLSYEKAAQLIGRHFPEVDDKLTNTLELQKLQKGERDLIAASVEQRIRALRPVPFHLAINFGHNLRYWPVVVIPFSVFLVAGLAGWWGELTESTKRIAAYDRDFVPEAPFDFVLLNENLEVEQGEDLKIRLSFEGVNLPRETHLVTSEGSQRMRKKNRDEYEFTLNAVQRSFDFYFEAAGYRSRQFKLRVLPVPRIRSMAVRVTPPEYTGIRPYETELKSRMEVPEGTVIQWIMDLEQTERAVWNTDSGKADFHVDNGVFQLSLPVLSSLQYDITAFNGEVARKQAIGNHLEVVRDQRPEIEVRYQRDTMEASYVIYRGQVRDDYGLTRLQRVLELDGEKQITPLPLREAALQQSFDDVLVLDSLYREGVKELRLYFEVVDNDVVNGGKAARSETFSLRLAGEEERREKLQKRYEKYFDESGSRLDQQRELENQLEEMSRQLRNKSEMSWQEKSAIKELLKKQQELLKKQQELNRERKKMNREEENLQEKPEDIKEQEERIEELSEEEKELQDLMNEIDRLMEELDTDRLRQKMEEMQQEMQESRENQERVDDLYKDLKFQKDVLEQAFKLKELSRKQEELAREMEREGQEDKEGEQDQNENAEEQGPEEDEGSSSDKQEELREEFEKVKEEIDKLREQNAGLDENAKEEKLDEQADEIRDEMDEALDKMQQGESPAEPQQQSSEGMDKMSESTQMALMKMQAQANQQNMESLRQILENLKRLSFDIEDLSNQTKGVDKDDPVFKRLLTEQRRLQLGAEVIKDSLKVLASKVPQLEKVVFEELGKVEKNLTRSIDELKEMQNAQAARHQQMVMTSANNLALMLDESLQQMRQMQAMQQKGNQNCQKPGMGKPKPSMQNMRKLQDELGQKMEEMKRGTKKGQGESKNSREIVEMLARQEKLRQALEGIKEQMGDQGDKGNMQKAIEEMRELEKDLWDGEIGDNYKERLKEINTRLLESEKAELEQKQDEKRESRTADNLQQIYNEELEKYLRERENEEERLDRVPLHFQWFYKRQASQYFGLP